MFALPHGTRLPRDPRALLDAPRGRMLCLELALLREPELSRLIWGLAHELDLERGNRVVTLRIGDEADGPEPLAPVSDRLTHAVARLTETVRDAVATGISAGEIAASLLRSVDGAAYWQPPRGDELVATSPAMRAALYPLAVALCEHAATGWWSRDRTEEQWALQWDAAGRGAPFDPIGQSPAHWVAEARDEEESARRDRPIDPTAAYGGSWWSVPPRSPATTGPMPAGIPAGIPLVEDTLGWERALAVPVRGGGVTLEIRSAGDWIALCHRFPLEVTASRRHEWYRVTGLSGTWIVPDWSRVAEEADAVHLSVWAYLTASGRALSLGTDRATMIAGFGPDATVWLTGAVREIDAPRVSWQATEPHVVGSAWLRREEPR